MRKTIGSALRRSEASGKDIAGVFPVEGELGLKNRVILYAAGTLMDRSSNVVNSNPAAISELRYVMMSVGQLRAAAFNGVHGEGVLFAHQGVGQACSQRLRCVG